MVLRNSSRQSFSSVNGTLFHMTTVHELPQKYSEDCTLAPRLVVGMALAPTSSVKFTQELPTWVLSYLLDTPSHMLSLSQAPSLRGLVQGLSQQG